MSYFQMSNTNRLQRLIYYKYVTGGCGFFKHDFRQQQKGVSNFLNITKDVFFNERGISFS